MKSDYKVPSLVKSWWRPWMGYTIGIIGFLWATLGFFNVYFHLGLPVNIFNQYSEIFVIALYGIPLIFIINDPYQKARMAVLVTLLVTLWYIIPVYFPFNVNIFGSRATTFPSFDVPGSWTNIGLFVLALLFGRRVKCGWMNTCVAIKETAGASFRRFTKRGVDYYKYKNLKWIIAPFYILYFLLLFFPDSPWRSAYFYWFWTITVCIYFGTLFFSPLFGPRFWCRWVCPFLVGWANVLGFFRVHLERDKCNDCGLCEKQCDFGLPLRELAKKNEKIRTTECMGCGRCRSVCPQKAISYIDVRDFIKEIILSLRKTTDQPSAAVHSHHYAGIGGKTSKTKQTIPS